MAQLTQAFPDKSFSGIGGIADFAHALNYFLLGCGTVQVCTAAMLDHAIGPNVIKALIVRHAATTMERHGLEDARGFPRHPPRPRRDALEDPASRRQGLSRRLRRRRICCTPKQQPSDDSSRIRARGHKVVRQLVNS